MNFQQKNKTISLPDQLKAVIEGAAQLKTEILRDRGGNRTSTNKSSGG